MNPMMVLMNQLQMQMKAKNPKLFQQFQTMQKDNPQDVLNNMLSNYTPEQIQQFRNFVSGFGITNAQLDKFGIRTK